MLLAVPLVIISGPLFSTFAARWAPVAVPELTSGPHFWYAMQWFMFAGIGILGIVVFIRSDLRDRRTAREKAAAEAEGERQRTPADT